MHICVKEFVIGSKSYFVKQIGNQGIIQHGVLWWLRIIFSITDLQYLAVLDNGLFLRESESERQRETLFPVVTANKYKWNSTFSPIIVKLELS